MLGAWLGGGATGVFCEPHRVFILHPTPDHYRAVKWKKDGFLAPSRPDLLVVAPHKHRRFALQNFEGGGFVELFQK